MKRARVDGVALEYEVTGSGEPVLFIHGALIADAFRPLLIEPRLTSRYRLVVYHRRGYAGSDRGPGPHTPVRQAADCRGLLDQLGIERAHVMGHSYGGAVALQLARDDPDRVHSLVLLEPALFGPATGHAYREVLAQSERRYHEAGAAVAVDEFLRARWPHYRDRIEEILPGAIAQAVTDAGVWFEHDSPGLRAWDFDAGDLRRIGQPALSILGSESHALSPRFAEVHRLLLARLPRGEGMIFPGAAHFPQAEHPRGMGEVLSAFLARHPMSSRLPRLADRG